MRAAGGSSASTDLRHTGRRAGFDDRSEFGDARQCQALLTRQPRARSQFLAPDHVMAPTVSGVFSVDLSSFDARITQPAEAELLGLVSTDQHCVSALTGKIRKAVTATGTPPTVEFFIA